MSHNISEIDRQEGIKQAWHGLTTINGELSLANCWLSTWDIGRKPLFIPIGEPGDPRIVPTGGQPAFQATGWQILYPSDCPNEIIGKPFNPESYRPITNAEFLELARKSTEGCPVKLVSAGSVRRRGRVFLSFESEMLPIYKAGGREFNGFINFGNGHDQSCVLWVNNSNICTVCDNTFSFNLAMVEKALGDQASGSRQRHTKNIVGRLPAMSEVIKTAILAQESFAIAFEKMASTPITGDQAIQLFTGFVAEPGKEKISTRAANIIAKLVDLFRTGKGNRGESLADVFSATTDYYTHESAGGTKNLARQFQSSEFGTGQDRKAEMFGLLAEPADVETAVKRGADRIQATEKAIAAAGLN